MTAISIDAAKPSHRAVSRRQLLAGIFALIALAGCSGNAASAGWVAFQRRGQGYAIDLNRGFSMPVAAHDATVFKQIAPLEWTPVRDAAVIDRVLADFNANRDQWQELPPYKRAMLWHPRPEPPL